MSTLLETARTQLKSGHAEDAIRDLQEHLASHPSDFDALLMLGIAHGQAAHFDDAAEVLSSAIQLNPNHPRARLNLGLAFQKMGQTEAALAEYERALELDPDCAPARQALDALRRASVPAHAHTTSPAISTQEREVFFHCPHCTAPVWKDQSPECSRCGANLQGVFKGYVHPQMDYSGNKMLTCGNCHKGVTRLDQPCAGCGRNLITGEFGAAPVAAASSSQARNVPTPREVDRSLTWGEDAIAPVWKRLLASWLDRFILNRVMMLIYISMMVSTQGEGSLSIAYVYLIPVIYETICIGSWGHTLGKWKFEIMVDKFDGSDITIPQALERACIKWGLYLVQDLVMVFAFPPEVRNIMWLFPSLSDLWALTNPNRRTLHDIMAGTIVVNA